MNKVFDDPLKAVADITPGSSVAVGGFGTCGVPQTLIRAVFELGADHLRVVSNNCGLEGWGLGLLLANGRIDRMTSSYVGENADFERRYVSGQLEVELVPQGTLAERLRAGGSGIAGFYTPTGIGTEVAEGGLPWRFGPDGSVAVASPPKERRSFAGRDYVLEEAISCDFALVRAAKGDAYGNLVFAKSARNFNPACAMAGRTTIAEVESLVEPGDIDPDHVHLPGIFVQRVVLVADPTDKVIERRKVRARSAAPGTVGEPWH
ncbi:MAG TPA: CoA transferase subunit A [Acidimicrobiales bacterium]|nr:CoA transferase subunit A [Acidimicrobiales bacterium]